MNDTDPLSPPTNSTAKTSSKRSLWKYIAIVILLASTGFGLAYAFRDRREECKGHLKALSRALFSYYDEYDSFPPAYTVNADGKKLHSWRTFLLPFVGEKELYSKIRFDEPWDSPHNKPFSRISLDIFSCPSANKSIPGRTHYFAVVGPATFWPEQYAIKITDIHDGTSNTICLVEANRSDVSWMEPRDLSRKEAIEWIQLKEGHRSMHWLEGCTQVVMGDTRVIALIPSIDIKVLLGLTSINGGARYPGVDWPDEPASAEVDFAEPQNASQLKTTEVWPVTNHKIEPGKSLIYCSTFQIAWDQARKIFGMVPIEFEGGSDQTDDLNSHPFSTTDLSPQAYVAVAGRWSEAIPLVRSELSEKFPAFQPKILELENRNQLIAYCYLQKNLPFRTSFDRLSKSLIFNKQPVESFGIERFKGEAGRDQELSRQMKIVDYMSDSDFIIRLLPRGGKDEIILAKLSPEKTLAATISSIQLRILEPNVKHTRFQLEYDDSFVAPVLQLNVERRFDEFINRRILTPGLTDLKFIDARQIIHFQLDENGAKIESEVQVKILGDDGSLGGPRKLVFDKPFLIWLKETQATEPYFAAWIANTELMLPFDQNRER